MIRIVMSCDEQIDIECINGQKIELINDDGVFKTTLIN